MARPFYLFGHNPNSVDDAVRRIEEGANALEPDVCWHEDARAFFVHEQIPFLPRFVSRWIFRGPSLSEYLAGLRERLSSRPDAGLALIAFDLKPPYSYDVRTLFDVVRREFTSRVPGVSILATVSTAQAMQFLAAAAPAAGEAVGVDEYSSPERVEGFFRPLGTACTYADGSSWFLTPTTSFVPDVRRALALRDDGGSFRLVYAWTVNDAAAMRTYLDLGVDGLITDDVASLRALLDGEYAGRYAMATPNDRPFG